MLSMEEVQRLLLDNSIPEPNSGGLGREWNGYGRTPRWIKGERFAHRVSFIVFRGPVPRDKRVLHSCDVGLCIEPTHFFLGTQQDNLLDCVGKGRNGYKSFQGEDHPRALFTAVQVAEIKSSNLSRRALAQKFSVPEGTIKRLRSRRVWKKLRGETRVSRR